MSNVNKFDGQVAIVTGASRGIGLAIAERLVQQGARVCITGRKDTALQEAALKLGGPNNALGIAGHSDDVVHQQEVVGSVLDTFGRVDMLVNSTGINPVYGGLMDLEHAAARRIFEVNCLAALSWVQQVHRSWMEEHGGAVVNVASIAGVAHAPGLGFYGASKAMLMHLTRQLGVELGPSMRVNAVAPGVVKTKFASALYENREEEVSENYPLERLGVPSDVAGAVSFLLSEDASWMTGQTVIVDGGVTLVGGS